MRTLTVMGYLGGDPEFKSTKNGANLVTFRLGNNELGEKDENGQPKTVWYTVTVWDGSLYNFCKYLKKGSGVVVGGDYSDRIYMSNKTGQCEISRDIKANSIYFFPSGKKDSDQTAPQAAAQPKPQPQPQAAPQPAPRPAAVETNPDSNEDDLPF